MALFPKCEIKVLLPGGVITAGKKIEGVLELDAPEEIPRAQGAELFVRTIAWAGYGGGKSRTVVRRDVFSMPMRSEIPRDVPLAAGVHRYPFTIDVPAWLPPNYDGNDCGVSTIIEARLDVDWAVDPAAKLTPEIVVPPLEGERKAATIRSPHGFHESIVLEVAIDTTVISADESLSGNIALRGGEGARFDAVVVSMRSVAVVPMGRGDHRSLNGHEVRIPKAALVGGRAAPFNFRRAAGCVPTFRNGYLDQDVVLDVLVDIPWARDPSFRVPLRVLPAGSTIVGQVGAEVVGNARLARLADAMASATGLTRGTMPTLVRGASGAADAVVVHVDDGPRDGRLGLDVDVAFPSVELGYLFRPRGMFDGFRDAPLLPRAHVDDYLATIERRAGKPSFAPDVVRKFLDALIGDVERGVEIRLDDHHLGLHFVLANDGSEPMVTLARVARLKAERVAEAIAELPFPEGTEGVAAAWRATAAEQSAFLVPSGPALHGVAFYARVMGGEERSMRATIRTAWTVDGPSTRVDLDLHAMPIPRSVFDTMDKVVGDRLAAVKQTFPRVVADHPEHVALERDGLTIDPRALFPAIEHFFGWLIDARGEHRSEHAYR